MLVTIGRNIVIDSPSNELLTWCEKNLVIDNPDYAKKERMHFWLGNTPKKLHLYERDGNALVLPFGTFRDVMPFFGDAEYQLAFNSQKDIDYGAPVPLYDYQQKAVDAVSAAKFGILQSRAGSGKTQMGIALIKIHGKRALWLTHTHDLLNQSKERAEQYIDKSLIGTITSGKVDIGAGVTFATVQTMCKLDLTLYRDMWDVIIVDECHRVAGTPTSMTQFGRVLNNLAARHKYGLSATVHRADGMIKATYSYLGQVVYTVPDEAVADKVMQVKIEPVQTGLELSRKCINTDGTINYTALIEYICTNEARNKLIARTVFENAAGHCLILSSRISQLEDIQAMLPTEIRSRSVLITGKMTSKKGQEERDNAIKDMRSGKKTILFATYNLCKEGLDVPILDRLFMASPQTDYAVITQSVGRIARTAQNKKMPVCYDFVDNIGYCERAYKKRCTTYRKNGCLLPKKG